MTVRFTVTRTAPGCMPEGRIQFCQHHSPEGVWQTRWLAHPNALRELRAVHLCVSDPEEAAQRYARYAGIPLQPLPAGRGRGYVQQTARGRLVVCDAARLDDLLGIEPPALPWIGAAELASADPARTATVLRDGRARRVPSRHLVRGDVVVLQSGDTVPADLRLVDVKDLKVEEAGLTSSRVEA